MLGILDHNLTTVTVPLLDIDDAPRSRKSQTSAEDRRAVREEFDADIFRSAKLDDWGKLDLAPVRSRDSGALSAGIAGSYQSARLLAVKADEERKSATPPEPPTPVQGTLQPTSPRAIKLDTADVSPQPFRKSTRSSSTASRSPLHRLRDLPPFEPLDMLRTEIRAASPAPSSLSMGMSTTRARSPSRVSEPSMDASSGQSTPKTTPARKLNNKSSKSSFGSRFGANWLLTALSGRSQPSFPTAAQETVGRSDVSSVTGNRSPSPISAKSPHTFPRPVPGAPIVTPSTPSPSKIAHVAKKLGHDVPVQSVTQPVPIAANKRSRIVSDDEPIKSFRNSFKASKSPGDSWQKAANFNQTHSHVTVNPCNPKENIDTSFGEGRRWQHLRAKPDKESQHLVKWTALTAPACLPLTTDFMPTTSEIQDFYEFNSYDIACYPDQVSFLVRADAANTNLPLAVMREMASQRLSRKLKASRAEHH